MEGLQRRAIRLLGDSVEFEPFSVGAQRVSVFAVAERLGLPLQLGLRSIQTRPFCTECRTFSSILVFHHNTSRCHSVGRSILRLGTRISLFP
jgi:hypothetical protein